MAQLKLIPIEKLLEMKANREEFILVDALPAESYKEGHMPGAVNLPSDAIAERAEDLLEKNAVIVVYCANYTCEASTIAAQKLTEMGYEHVLDYKAGKKGWQNAGFELEQ